MSASKDAPPSAEQPSKSCLKKAEKREFSADDLLVVEREKVGACRKERLGDKLANAPWSGIGLSGGGIRSASLALGVLQAFAEHDLLRRFDYISSVSGGGYLAGALQWWWYDKPREDNAGSDQPKFGLGKVDFPYGPARISNSGDEAPVTKRARSNLEFLRAHSSYLTPGNGLTSWSMLAVLVRTTIISLFIWIPVLAGLFAALFLADSLFLNDFFKAHLVTSPLGYTNIRAYWQLASCPVDGPDKVQCEFAYRAIYASLLYLFYAFAGAFCVVALLFGFVSRAPEGLRANRTAHRLLFAAAIIFLFSVYYLRELWHFKSLWEPFPQFVLPVAIGTGSAIFGVLVALAILVAAAEVTPKSLNASYWLRRNYEIAWGWSFIPSLFTLAVATIPLVPYFLSGQEQASVKGTLAGTFGLLSGVAAAVYGYYTFLRNLLPSFTGQIFATTGAALYLYAILVMAFCLSIVWGSGDVYSAQAIEGSFILALLLSFFANINYVGLHRFYRDRLMEAFMPADSTVTAGRSRYSPIADNLLVTDLVRNQETSKLAPVPYPLINTNVIMVDDHDRKVAVRGGDNFIISPLFVGSSVTGWRRSKDYMDDAGPLTLASSIAASGAAATASAGYIGTGITMNPIVAAAMALLNIRLGLWMLNPAKRRWWISAVPTFIHPGLCSAIFSLHHRGSRFVELTDGGHFENLGLYELVRRKLSVVLVVDGEADPSISLASLVSATRRIEQDFKATLTFEKAQGKGPERLMMYEEKGYPSGLRYSQSPFLVATIKYNDGTSGTLIYVKSTLIRGMDFTTAGYLATNPTFPHQSTIDQFFDQDQFDAYRYLGYDTAQQLIEALDLTKTIGNKDDILNKYKALDETTLVEDVDLGNDRPVAGTIPAALAPKHVAE
jgi:hypothetical protein